MDIEGAEVLKEAMTACVVPKVYGGGEGRMVWVL